MFSDRVSFRRSRIRVVGVNWLILPVWQYHMLVSKIKPCTSKYEHLYCETANGSLNQLLFTRSYHYYMDNRSNSRRLLKEMKRCFFFFIENRLERILFHFERLCV